MRETLTVEKYNELAIRIKDAILAKAGDLLAVEEKRWNVDRWSDDGQRIVAFSFSARADAKIPKGTWFSVQVALNPRGGVRDRLGVDVKIGGAYSGQPVQVTAKNADAKIPEVAGRIDEYVRREYQNALDMPARIKEARAKADQFKSFVDTLKLDEVYIGDNGTWCSANIGKNIDVSFHDRDSTTVKMEFHGLNKDKIAKLVQLLREAEI